MLDTISSTLTCIIPRDTIEYIMIYGILFVFNCIGYKRKYKEKINVLASIITIYYMASIMYNNTTTQSTSVIHKNKKKAL